MFVYVEKEHALERIDKEETTDKSDYYTAGGK